MGSCNTWVDIIQLFLLFPVFILSNYKEGRRGKHFNEGEVDDYEGEVDDYEGEVDDYEGEVDDYEGEVDDY